MLQWYILDFLYGPLQLYKNRNHPVLSTPLSGRISLISRFKLFYVAWTSAYKGFLIEHVILL